MTTAPLTVYKGHGTENDFVVVEDLDDELELLPDLVRALCDRRAGIGADGILRVVRAATGGGGPAAPTGNGGAAGERSPEFFMDYRNCDGSVAEMCGNGARVFVRYLLERGLAELDGLSIATRAGTVAVAGPAADEPTEWIAVTLGPSAWIAAAPRVGAPGLVGPRAGVAVSMPNPHVVVFVEQAELDALDLTRAPSVDPPLPHGQNVEFVVRNADGLRLRVYERGVGETRSCGTGIAAAVVAAAATMGSASEAAAGESAGAGPAGAGPAGPGAVPPADGGDGRPWQVKVPGGNCAARWLPDGRVRLSGPAVIVARIDLDPGWLDAVRE